MGELRVSEFNRLKQQKAKILTRQQTEAEKDTERLNWLEKEMLEEPLLLHNCRSGDEFPPRARGLGLTPRQPRTLREAIDAVRREIGDE